MNPSLAQTATSTRRLTRQTSTFPFVALPARDGGVPVEVCLVARLTHGSGNKLFYGVLARQRQHDQFVDELDEPSAKLGGTDFAKGDATALYSFGVGHRGHPFHRHEGHRVFTAVSGSGGAQLRFSSATPDELARDPASFVRALRHVNVPPDCLFTVRFSGETWHQFSPLEDGSGHPAFFALSCHTNELGGQLSDELRQQVLANRADIPSLTQLLPAAVVELLRSQPVRREEVPTTVLSLDDAPGSLLEAACKQYRSVLGHVCGTWARMRQGPGYVSEIRPARVFEHHASPAHSLLRRELADRRVHHEDRFTLTLPAASLGALRNATPDALLAAFLDGFLANRPTGVTRLMSLRNWLVRPLKLRTSPLGCPVSSLLGAPTAGVFAGRFPVREQAVGPRLAQVILGADDRHLVFRSCVAVEMVDDERVEFSLATRVACKNLFGRFYMAAISSTHRRYIAPAMLEHAVDAIRQR
jgi:hypothetical protein